MTPEELWALPVDEFNKWREENDLPKLFNFFNSYLPDFNIWLNECGFELDFLVKLTSPGEVFHGETEKYMIESNEQSGLQYFFVEPKSKRAGKKVKKISEEQNQKVLKFTPYLLWGSKRFKKKNFIPTKYSGKVETLSYTTGTAPDVPDMCSWVLLSGITVLKLGGVTIKSNYWINGRNLDFTNLDFLKIEGKYHGNTSQKIFYSHCHNIELVNAELNFFEFNDCDIHNFRLTQDSSIYSFVFRDGNLWNLVSKDSSIRNSYFYNCSISRFNLQNTFIEDLNYIPKTNERHQGKSLTYETISDNYKRFRLAFSKIGARNETKECYYYERKYDMLKKISDINTFYGSYKFSFRPRKLFYLIRRIILDIYKAVIKLLKSINPIINFLTWGFGEKPQRLLFLAPVVILIYSIIYSVLKIKNVFAENLYFSLISFTRVGGNEVQHLNSMTKLLIGSEALIGWIIIVFIINGYANKTKY